MSLTATALSASLTVKDLEQSLAWYRDVVGFAVAQRYEREGTLMAVRLQAGDVLLLINQDNGAKGWDRAKGEGFSLQITTAEDIDTLAGRLKANGVTLDTEPTDTPWGKRVFRFHDLDGFKFAVSS